MRQPAPSLCTRYVSRQFSRPFDKFFPSTRGIMRYRRIFVKQMDNTAARLSILRNAKEERAAPVTSCDGVLSRDRDNLLSRAALFRLEADALRLRARAMDETIICDQYFKLADRWSMLAAGLELQVLVQVTAPE